ncbi:BTAD domain-containing putative transcriptional regulator [Nocardioides bigeumensis]
MEISVGDATAALPGSAERALLVQLLLSPGRVIPATLLVDRLWSESSLPLDPMNALQIRVSKLRRALRAMGAPDVVTREGVGYRANVDPSSVDAVDFELRLRQARADTPVDSVDHDRRHLDAYDAALSLWRGEALSDFATEQWAVAEAARLTELRLAGLTERSQVALALGRHHEVVADLEPLVSADPTLESLAGLLMVALYRSNRQADALDVYTRTRELLDESLGLEPSLTLRSLHERVLRQDEALGGQADVATRVVIRTAEPRSDVGRQAVVTNLPAVVRPLIGRDHQLDSLVQLLGGVRMLTLIGPGGAGKTSLALAAVLRSVGSYADGVFGVRLAPVSAPDQIPLAVAEALGVPMDGAAADGDVRERVVAYLARREMLLLVDNCEHVIDAAAALVDELLGRCPGLTVMATSREALAIPDEVQVNVGPLDVPPKDAQAGRVLDFPAAQLFVERARSVRPGMVLDEMSLHAVGAISRSLDGIPLALELAAARVTAMSPVEIAQRLEHRFTLLTSGSRTAEARQQTLRATVDWSYDLLTEPEKRAFERLSVFRGGWTLTAAESVAADDDTQEGEILDVMGRLVERSMVVVEPGPYTRYRMLETLREYAGQRLVDSGLARTVERRHAEYFRDFALHAESGLRGHDQRDTMRALRDEQSNIRAALAWLVGPGEDIDSALVTASALALFWHLGRHLEGRDLLGRLLARESGSPMALGRALQAVSLVERPRGCLVHPSPKCAQSARESLEIFEELGDAPRAALSRVLLAVEGVTGAEPELSRQLLSEATTEFQRSSDLWGEAVIGFVRMETGLKTGREDDAVSIGRETAAAFRQLDDPWGLSAILYHLGWGLRQFGRYDEGSRVLEEAIDVAASAGLYNTVQWALADLAIAQLHLGDEAAARDLFDRASAASEHIGDGAGTVLAHYGHGLLAQVREDWREAQRLFEQALSGFEQLSTPVPQGLALAGLARCDEALGDTISSRARYEVVLDQGGRVGEPALIATALEGLARLAHAAGDDQVADLVARAQAVRRQFVRPAPPHERRDMERLHL